jgi:hypothetical protein
MIERWNLAYLIKYDEPIQNPMTLIHPLVCSRYGIRVAHISLRTASANQLAQFPYPLRSLSQDTDSQAPKSPSPTPANALSGHCYTLTSKSWPRLNPILLPLLTLSPSLLDAHYHLLPLPTHRLFYIPNPALPPSSTPTTIDTHLPFPRFFTSHPLYYERILPY